MNNLEKCREVFEKFDRDKSGKICCKELLTVLMELGKDKEAAQRLAVVSPTITVLKHVMSMI